MPSLQPEVLPTKDGGRSESVDLRSKLTTIAVVVPLLASVVGNIIQITSAANDRRETQAKIAALTADSQSAVAKLERDQKESSERLVQTWLEQLRKFESLEDRALVLNAAISTTSDARVRAWAMGELATLKTELERKKAAAEALLAAPAKPLAVAAAVPTAESQQPGPSGTVKTSGVGAVKPASPAGAGTAAAPGPSPVKVGQVSHSAAVAAATMNSRQAASVDLARLTKAENVLQDAEVALRAASK